VYVRSTGETSTGIEALLKKGAIAWPDPQDVEAFNEVLDAAALTRPEGLQGELSPLLNDPPAELASHAPSEAEPRIQCVPESTTESSLPVSIVREPPCLAGRFDTLPKVGRKRETGPKGSETLVQGPNSPADAFSAVEREVLRRLQVGPMKGVEVAAALEISTAQAKLWLKRFVDEGVLEKQKKRNVYFSKPSRLFE
jgi:DNA processing protein